MGSAAGSRQRRQPYFSVAGRQRGAGGGSSSATVASAARRQRWQHRGRALGSAWRRWRERSGSGGGGVSTPAASSLAVAAAAWRQRGVGCGSTIDNQLKASAATASETATVVFRKEWYRKTSKEVIEGRPLLHRLLGSILKDVEFV